MKTMNQKLTMCKGVQGSGKSTWAKEYVKNNRNVVRVNNDEFRLTFFNRQFDEKDSKDINAAREYLIEYFLNNGVSVIVDNMNLSPKHELQYRKLAEKHCVEFEIKDFTHVPLETCIERDSRRENPIGKKIITKMYNQFIRKEPPKIERIEGVPDCFIFDLDGTLALMNNRSPYDEAKADQDFVNKHVYYILHCIWSSYDEGFYGDLKIILMSGRDEGRGREATERWLENKDIRYDYLYMRSAGDTRSDDIIKEELYNSYVKGKYNCRGVFDDRLRVCKLWYKLGLPLFRVGDPEADF